MLFLSVGTGTIPKCVLHACLVGIILKSCVCLSTSRQVLQELRAEAVRQQAEDEAWYTQQELLQQAEEQRRRILQEEENKLVHQRTRSLSLSF